MAEAPERITAFYSGTFGEKGYWRPEPDDLAMPEDAIMPTRYVLADVADEMLAALRRIAGECMGTGGNPDGAGIERVAMEAIAKAEGERDG